MEASNLQVQRWIIAMDLDQQIQALIQDAPQDGTTPILIEAIAPILKQFGKRLRHSQYYIVQTLDQNWAVTTLSNRAEPDVEKQVIYAYPSLKDVESSPYPMKDPQLIALPIPVTHILFQLIALEGVDSIIFFEVPNNTFTGTEIQRMEMQEQMQTYLQNHPISLAPELPPDIA